MRWSPVDATKMMISLKHQSLTFIEWKRRQYHHVRSWMQSFRNSTNLSSSWPRSKAHKKVPCFCWLLWSRPIGMLRLLTIHICATNMCYLHFAPVVLRCLLDHENLFEGSRRKKKFKNHWCRAIISRSWPNAFADPRFEPSFPLKQWLLTFVNLAKLYDNLPAVEPCVNVTYPITFEPFIT